MEPTQIYAISLGAVLGCLLLLNVQSTMVKAWGIMQSLLRQHLVYPTIVGRHQYAGPWSRAELLLTLLFLTLNGFCMGFKISSLTEAGIRAAKLCLINLIPLLGNPQTAFLANVLGISRTSCHQAHVVGGLMSGVMLVVHVIIAIIVRRPFSLEVDEDLWGLIGALVILATLVFALRFFRRLLFELFIKSHQMLAGLLAYALWQHLRSASLPSRIYLYISLGMSISILALSFGLSLFRNKAIGSNWPRAYITHTNGAINIRLRLSRPLKVAPGQYVCLWIPAISLWSFLQCHPFAVTSWAEGTQEHLEMLIKPRSGWTLKLLAHSKSHHGGSDAFALFSGPYGIERPTQEYQIILLVATGFGIAALLPYLKKIIHEYNSCKTQTRRVHLIWELDTIDTGIAVQSLLNNVLHDDTLDDGYIFNLSIYINSGRLNNTPFGSRATLYTGNADLKSILHEELSEQYIKRVQEEQRIGAKMLVLVSAEPPVRDTLQVLVQEHGEGRVELAQLEYQPAM